MSDDLPSGTIMPDPVIGGTIADPPLAGSLVTVEPIEVDLPGGQGIAGPPGRAGAVGPVATVVCAEPVAAGLPVYVDRATRQIRVARADTYRAAFVAGIALDTTPSGFALGVAAGQVIMADWTAATGAADLVPGLVYFLTATGGLVPDPPLGPGLSIVTVGRAADARTLFVAPSNPILQ